MDGKTKKVLVVDDDSFIREVLAAVLEGDNYAVVTAENGAMAFATFSADSEIGIIITDVNMPEMDGMELVRKIREAGSDVPVIILTGDSDIDLMESGVSGSLLKDENLADAVVPLVEKVLQGRL